jgi:hypothetical protein
MIRHFRNEVGHDITIDIQEKKGADVDVVLMSMAGPDSDTQWEVTKGEAQALYEILGKVLGWK